MLHLLAVKGVIVDPQYVSISEASELTNKSQSWVRTKLKNLTNNGRATKNSSGHWEIERAAILAFCARSKVVKAKTISQPHNESGTEWLKIVEVLRTENSELRTENKQLRSEIVELLKAKSSLGIVSRWLRI